jgi:hypothetical protein
MQRSQKGLRASPGASGHTQRSDPLYSSAIHPPCPNMIIGISLVVNELNKGQRMVFRYPESIPASVEQGQSKGLKKLYNQYFSLR